MLIKSSMQLISVQYWTPSWFPGLLLETRLPKQTSRLLEGGGGEGRGGEGVTRGSKEILRYKNGRVYFECEIFKESTRQNSLVGSFPSIILA